MAASNIDYVGRTTVGSADVCMTPVSSIASEVVLLAEFIRGGHSTDSSTIPSPEFSQMCAKSIDLAVRLEIGEKQVLVIRDELHGLRQEISKPGCVEYKRGAI